jgi:uncharacterized protein (DUF1015 family)
VPPLLLYLPPGYERRAQTGLVGCASIEDYINNVIKKHEKTLAKKEMDRINHVNTTDANTARFSYLLQNDEISSIIEDYTRTPSPFTISLQTAFRKPFGWLITLR